MLKSTSTLQIQPSPRLPFAISSKSYRIEACASASAISRLQNKASQQEKDAATASTKLSNQISTNMGTAFNNSQQIQSGLNSQLQNITNAGLAGKGFLGGQEAALRSQSKQNAAQSTVSAEQALNQRNAGGEQGGAASSGAVAAGNERLASTAAAGDAANQLAITNQNGVLARQNLSTGLSGLEGLSGQETGQADALSGTAVNGAGQSFNEETQAHQPSTFWSGLGTSVLGMGLNAIAPGVGSLATGILGRKPSNAQEAPSDAVYG